MGAKLLPSVIRDGDKTNDLKTNNVVTSAAVRPRGVVPPHILVVVTPIDNSNVNNTLEIQNLTNRVVTTAILPVITSVARKDR